MILKSHPFLRRFFALSIPNAAILLMLLFCGTLSAQISITTNRANAYFDAGETAQFSITSMQGGPVQYKIGYDQLTPAIASGTVNTTAGGPTQVPYTSTQASAVFCWITQNGLSAKTQAVFSPYKLQPAETEPTDFDAFWSSQKALLQAVPINAQLTPYSNTLRSNTFAITQDFIDGRKIYGYISIPIGTGPFPAIVSFPPFGQNAGLVHPLDYMTDELGVISIALSIHNAPAAQSDPNAYLPNDPTDRNSIYYRYPILSGLRTIDYLFSRADFDKQNLALMGESQGGGLSMMVAGLDNRVKLVIGSLTALSEHTAWKYGRATGFPNYVNTASVSTYGNQVIVNNTVNATKYYDVQYFAKRYAGPTLTALGYKDEVSPISTILSALNQTKGQHTIIHCHDLEHNHPDEYWTMRNDAIRRYLMPTRTPANNPFPPSGTGYVADAGPDATATEAIPFALNGKVEYNLAENTSFPVKWELLAGPGTVLFSNPLAKTSTATFSAPGTYYLRFQASDETLLASKSRYVSCHDVVKISVLGGPAPIGPCNPIGKEPWWQWISNVKIADLNNSSTKDSYGNFSSKIATINKSRTIGMALTPSFSWQSFDEYWRVWIDWNNDSDFEDAGEMVFENHGTSVINGSFASPDAGYEGLVKMRVAMKNGAYAAPCEEFQYGEVEDYTVDVKPVVIIAPPCSITTQISGIQCIDNGTPTLGTDDTWKFSLNVQAQNGSLSGWSAAVNNGTLSSRYDSLITFAGLSLSNNLTLTVVDKGNPTCSNTVNVTKPAPCVIVPPPPPPPATYCTYQSDYPWHEWISSVNFNNTWVTQSSGKSVYSDFTNKVIPVKIGSSTQFRLLGQFSWVTYKEYWQIWIDFNRNGAFEYPGELVFQGTTNAPQGNNGGSIAERSGAFNVSSLKTPGATRMRIVMGRAPLSFNPCGTIPNGEVEDYTADLYKNNFLSVNDDQLAVNLLARKEAGNALLKWTQVVSGTVVATVLERSTDGENYVGIHAINTGSDNYGSFLDENPAKGSNFYRIRLMMQDGEDYVSTPRQLDFENLDPFTVFPNPAKDALFVEVSAYNDQAIKITLLDALGKSVITKQIPVISDHFVSLDLKTVGNGIYFLQIESENRRREIKKVVVEKAN